MSVPRLKLVAAQKFL